MKITAVQRPAARRSRARSRTAWLRQHRASLLDTIANLRANSGAAVLSVLVIGVTLALPLGLHVMQGNLATLVGRLGSRPQATLYLEQTATRSDAEALVAALGADDRLGAVRLIDKEAAWAEFAELSDLDGAVVPLADNPLPYTVVVQLGGAPLDGDASERLQAELERTAGVAEAQFDITWIRRLRGIADFAARATLVFATILAAGVVLITGNTIRVGIHHRREEIEVAKLCGATDAFVRRPFLYSGAAQGLMGAIVAAAIVAVAFGLLAGPAEKLAALYDSNLQLINLSALSVISTLLTGTGLGLIGAWIAVTVYLRRIDITRSD